MSSADPEKALATVEARPLERSSAASTYSSNEKGRTSEVERVEKPDEGPLEPPLYNAHIDVSGVDERKLMRKIDLYLVPWLSFLYLLSFLDRTSIGNAKVRACVLRLGDGLAGC